MSFKVPEFQIGEASASNNIRSLGQLGDNFIVIDFEATCGPGITKGKNEIIEWGCAKLDKDFNIISTYQQIVKPQMHPKLTQFCIDLTGITQKMIDKEGIPFKESYEQFLKWRGSSTQWGSWGAYDRYQLIQDCKLHNLQYGKLFGNRKHTNLKQLHQNWYKRKRGAGLKKALRMCNLSFDGRQHRALTDTKAVAKILNHMQSKQWSVTYEDLPPDEHKRIMKIRKQDWKERQQKKRDRENANNSKG